MGRKINKYMSRHGKSASSSEKESLLNTSSIEDCNSNNNNNSNTTNVAANGNFNLNVPHESEKKRRLPERKKSAWAPVATATVFEDVPVFTICPYCSSKVVTKTHFKRGKKHWFCCCCCLPYFLDVFKDVIHSCPKCNTQIAIYNRFHFFNRGAGGGGGGKEGDGEPTTEETNGGAANNKE